MSRQNSIRCTIIGMGGSMNNVARADAARDSIRERNMVHAKEFGEFAAGM
ncbi:hypothetical protein SAMN04487912_101229 [Arthrobacter sp. cf158]|nr:hypothetical protein [Arthrobacter sp. cf158]SDW04095.1 hypothetical protein SAMN04487912_101229 [Arthrobacter sp. cf158]